MAAYEEALDAFLQGDEHRQVRESLEEVIKKAFAAGWIAALMTVAAERERE